VILVYSSDDIMKQIIIYEEPFMFEAVIRQITDQREDKNIVRSFFFFSPLYSFFFGSAIFLLVSYMFSL
jgi:hypothetical protein